MTNAPNELLRLPPAPVPGRLHFIPERRQPDQGDGNTVVHQLGHDPIDPLRAGEARVPAVVLAEKVVTFVHDQDDVPALQHLGNPLAEVHDLRFEIDGHPKTRGDRSEETKRIVCRRHLHEPGSTRMLVTPRPRGEGFSQP